MSESTTDDTPQPAWRPLNSSQRRVLGVLMEKAKTTPDAYPMTLKAITTGSNQKSNRDPQMELDVDRVEEALEELREMKAVAEIQGDGRVSKYRHFAYEWFGVDKVEMAIMAELLLRGEQTVGELRGRAARMEPISGVDALMPILKGLIDRKLVVALSPPGRGQVVTHGLYKDRELDDLSRRATALAASSGSVSTGSASSRPSAGGSSSEVESLRAEIAELRSEVGELRGEVEMLKSMLN